jgi:[ribosomal protein S18]-alanine N-acetyltransferase
MTVRIRRLSPRDVWEVLAIERQVFPEDHWTAETARGRLARSWLGRPRYAARFERLIRLVWLTEALQLIRLICFAGLRWPATRHYIVVEADGTIAGYACLNAIPGGRADIQTVAVRPDREGQGIGTALLGELIAKAAALQCPDVYLYVRAGNARACALYRRNGFTEAGVRPRYYQPSGTDALVMRLHVPSRVSPRV